MPIRLTKKHLFVALIMFGIISILFPLLSSVYPIVGISVISLIIGGIMSIKSVTRFLCIRSIVGIVVVLVGLLFLSFGCAIKAPMNPHVGEIGIKKKLPIEAGLLITEKTKNYIFVGESENLHSRDLYFSFPLGFALESASIQAFSQVFQKVTLIRTSTEAKNYKVVIEPEIKEFHFRFGRFFEKAVLSRIKVHVTLTSGETRVWEMMVESPEHKKRLLGPVVWLVPQREMGESAAEALVFVLKKIAMEIAEDAFVKKFVEKQLTM